MKEQLILAGRHGVLQRTAQLIVLLVAVTLPGLPARGQYASVGDEYGGMWVDSSWWNGFFSSWYDELRTRAQMVTESRVRLQQSSMAQYQQTKPKTNGVTLAQQMANPPPPTELRNQVTNTAAVLSWKAVYIGGNSSRGYNLQIASSTNFAKCAFSGTVPGTSYTFQGTNNTTYYWRVGSIFDQPGAYSGSNSFGIIIDTDPPIQSPTSFSSLITSNYVSLAWDPAVDASGVAGYILQIADSGDFSNVVVGTWVSPGTNIQTTYSTKLLGPGSYRWRVAAVDVRNQISSYQGKASFTISNDPSDTTPPVLSSAAPRVSNGDTFVRFEWDDASDLNGINCYQLQASTSMTNFADSRFLDAYTVTRQYTALEQSPGAIFFRVRAQDNRGNWSEWSSPWNYTNQVPTPCALVNVKYGPNAVVMKWELLKSVPNATYRLEVYSDEIFSNLVYATNTALGSVLLDATVVTPGRQYIWRVRALDSASGMVSDWSMASLSLPLTETRMLSGVANRQLATSLAWSDSSLVVGNMDSTIILKRNAVTGEYTNDWATSAVGSSSAAGGGWLILGNPTATASNLTKAGSVLIADLEGTVGKTFVSPRTSAGGNYGWSVATDGNWALVGAPDEPRLGTNCGSVYCYKRNGTTWTLDSELTATPQSGAWFGQAVAINGEWAWVGAAGRTNQYSKVGLGTCYIYRNVNGVWMPFQWIEAPLTAAGFGWSLSMDGQWAIVGSSQTTFSDSGMAYIYRWNGTRWAPYQILRSDAAASNETGFGQAVSIKGDWAAVSPLVDSTAGPNAGSTYLYHFNGRSWDQNLKLTSKCPTNSAFWGYSARLADDGTLFVGAPGDSSGGATNAGSLSMFSLPSLPSRTPLTYASGNLAVSISPSRTVTFDWSNAITGFNYLDYEINVDNYRLFDSPEYAEHTSATSATTTPLSPGYYAFRLRARLPNGQWGNWNDTSFIQISAASTNSVTVTFDAQGGTPPSPLSSVVTVGLPYGNLPFTSQPNCVFGGWFTDTNDPTTLVSSVTVVSQLTNHVLYARWIPGGQAAYKQISKTSVGFTPASLAASEDTIVVGAPDMYSGVVYVFVKSGTNWTLQATLSDGRSSAYIDRFGCSVAISGDTVVVGARDYYSDIVNPNSEGAVFIYVRSGTSWTRQAFIDIGGYLLFDGGLGTSVAISGDTMVAGQPRGNNPSGKATGKAVVYVRNGSTWTSQGTLLAADGQTNDWFGMSVAVAGNAALVGCPYDGHNAAGAGSAYLFTNNGTSWFQAAKLTPSTSVTNANVGLAVALSSNLALVGQRGMSTAPLIRPSVFSFYGTNWRQQAALQSSSTNIINRFGSAIAINGSNAVVGAQNESSYAGAAYTFSKIGTNWLPVCTLPAPEAANSHFANAVAFSGKKVVATASSPSAFYVFGSPGVMLVLGSSNAIPSGSMALANGADFGSVPSPGGWRAHTFIITNTGDVPLHLNGVPKVFLSGANPADFIVASDPPNSIDPGGIASFILMFAPTRPGVRTATVNISSDDVTTDPYTFAVQGTAAAAASMDVLGNSVSILNGDSVPGTSDFTDFGPAEMDSGRITNVFVIKNSGAVDLNLAEAPGISFSGDAAGDYAIVAQPTATLSPGSTSPFSVSFAPKGAGIRSATICISNNTVHSPYTFAIQGTGLFYPALITVQPTNQTVVQGATAGFWVGATGTDLQYQWQTNGVPMLGATNSSFALANAQTTGLSCSVIVWNSAATNTSSAAILTVLSLPTVTTLTPASISQSSAVVCGSVLTMSPSTVWFEWGCNSNLETSSIPILMADTPNTVTISNCIGGLADYSVYCYRAVASNTAGVTYGATSNFVTLPRDVILSNLHSPASGKIRFGFAGSKGGPYSVWSSRDLGQWFPLGDAQEASSGQFYFEDSPTNSGTFYQIRVK